MLLKHNPRSFMTGDDPFIRLAPLESNAQSADLELVFEAHHEGFIGIPHGGLAMGLCLDAWRRTRTPSYPINVNFRFGGSGVAIGEQTVFHVEESSEGPGMVAEITKPGDKRPYLKADIGGAVLDQAAQMVPKPPGPDFRELPYYANCFVCGHHRNVPGLMRRFRVHEQNGNVVTTSPWAMEEEDLERAGLFLIDREELHPAVLISIFDENTGWSGFMDIGAAGLSVRLEVTLFRPVTRNESLLFMGWPAGIRGNPRAPRFFSAEGAILSMTDPGNPQAVAYGKGEWVILEKYTRQIKENLHPRDSWDWIFPA